MAPQNYRKMIDRASNVHKIGEHFLIDQIHQVFNYLLNIKQCYLLECPQYIWFWDSLSMIISSNSASREQKDIEFKEIFKAYIRKMNETKR